ncbi:glycosyltransferase family 9 protein [Acetobacter conturbans]|uniref:ADP-heptose--LPS heptosyltransferase n=1 Tax=Acetobacter conturbans TaxID=1737472 RepID=A0ABX0K1R9_9PROT|nr:glycosyltransferase family 9 protein [Acetobacter conturbans]NHN89059.1 ADP-heptose--LPS heptosyltransferase [Acetobacter conturbans]
MTRILVIRLGALGDFVQSFPAFAAIRAHHPDAAITLLTTTPFRDLATASPWFDSIETDTRPKITDRAGIKRLKTQLSGFDRIYDLQTSSRSSWYHRFAGAAAWSGIARGASLPHANPWRDEMHTRTRQRDQLRMAGIPDVPEPDLGWLTAGGPILPVPYAVLVPGAAPHRPGKRWPAQRYGALAQHLLGKGLLPVLIGGPTDGELATTIRAACPDALDLTGKTSLIDLGGLCARARLAVGNDTGPMHLAAAVGCRCLVLFSSESDPALTAPLGRRPEQVSVLRVNDIATLSVDRVVSALG